MSDNEEDANIPPAAECERRCQEFADITGTDSALAMFYLQDREWDLDRALNSYFEEASASSSSDLVAKETKKEKREKPQVVFLQECIEETETILQSKCHAYHCIPGDEDGYYTMIMLRLGHVELEDTSILPFSTSSMGRNLLSVKCKVKGEKFQLITSHLESTKDFSVERKRQLKTAFSQIATIEKDRTVVFGGDLNLRDNELAAIGGLPDNIQDIWEVTGKRPEAKFTWDTQRNDNLEWSSKYKPRCRFDRLYIRHSEPRVVKPEYFELIGLERLKSCQRFCSDHWGLLAHFNILSKLPK